MFGFGIFKKLVVLCLLALIVGGVFLGRDVVSYATTGRSAIRDAVKDQIPIEFELKRARNLIEDIMPELQANMKLVAKEEVEIESLQEDVAAMDHRLAAEKENMSRLAKALKQSKDSYVFAGKAYTRGDVQKDLSRRFERYRNAEMVLAGKKKLLDTRRHALVAATEKLRTTQNAKAMLEDQVRSIEAQFHVIQAAQATSKFALDDSKLSQAERLLKELKKRLEVSQRVLDNHAEFIEDIPVETETPRDIADQVTRYLGEKAN